MHTITLDLRGAPEVVAASPVTRAEYRAFAEASGRPMPPTTGFGERPSASVTEVSQADAAAYCAWLGGRASRPCRLPTMAELHELSEQAAQEGIDIEVWGHTHSQRPELRGGLKPTYLCEWTVETEELPQFGTGRPPRVLGSIFYPPWVRHGSNAAHAQAFLAATEGYSFVTFRVAFGI